MGLVCLRLHPHSPPPPGSFQVLIVVTYLPCSAGTPAGDPVEAEAISTAFFGAKSGFKPESEASKLLVGSIKTVIGHTEGTAGLASLLKVSLALQQGKVPPNLHLNRISPTVKPHYLNLEIPTTLRDWPQLPEGAVRRASVNSFGFGGAVSSPPIFFFGSSQNLSAPPPDKCTSHNGRLFQPHLTWHSRLYIEQD